MRKLLLILAIIILLGMGTKPELDQEDTSFIEQFQSGITVLSNTIDIDHLKDQFKSFIQVILGKIDEITDETENKVENTVDKLPLEKPENQTFSIANIEIGYTEQQVKQTHGEPERISRNEYGTNWHTYHDHYQNFFMVTYKDNQVAGMFTNQDLISSNVGIRLGTPKSEVRKVFGEPLSTIQKGLVLYQIPDEREYDIFLTDGNYVTIFYDKHANDTVVGLQIISESLEKDKTSIYPEPTSELIVGFEYQLFDLTNAERVKHGLSVLSWDEHVRITARNHSIDMAENSYFSHTNLQGEDPFDRMKADQIHFILAGENLAYGQFSSIFAHIGLLNSLGHRENILKSDFKYLGVGVAFNEKDQPFYTQNFFAK